MEDEMIFGIRAVIEAVEAGKEIDRLLIKKDMQGDLSRELFAAIKGLDIPVQRVPLERLNRITRKNHQGVIAFTTQITYQHVEDLVPLLFEEGKDPFFVLLDGVTDVRNFGAIARTAECAGVDAIILPSRNSVSVNAMPGRQSSNANIPAPHTPTFIYLIPLPQSMSNLFRRSQTSITLHAPFVSSVRQISAKPSCTPSLKNMTRTSGRPV